MTPDIASVLPHTREFEDCIPWLYLDTKGIVTGGVGCALLSVAEAQSLPFLTPQGGPATADQIASDYQRVKAMRPGLRAAAYRCATSVLLSDDAINSELVVRFERVRDGLLTVFPQYESFPVSGQAALLDMGFNLGIGHAGPPPTGLHEYHTHLIPALLKTPPDWNTAAANCARNAHMAAFAARNEWTASQFSACMA